MAGWLPEHPRLPVIDDVGDLLVYVAIALVFGRMALAPAARFGAGPATDGSRRHPRSSWPSCRRCSRSSRIRATENAYDGAFLLTLGGLGIVLGWPPNAARRRTVHCGSSSRS
jgi:hypothetical protein